PAGEVQGDADGAVELEDVRGRPLQRCVVVGGVVRRLRFEEGDESVRIPLQAGEGGGDHGREGGGAGGGGVEVPFRQQPDEGAIVRAVGGQIGGRGQAGGAGAERLQELAAV